jgi:lipoyl(octanoyl) transferase
MREINVIDLGRTQYRDAWDLQKNLFALRSAGTIRDTLLLTEHGHVYTLGKSSNEAHLLAREKELTDQGIDVFHIDRGGDVTYHGPGQIVAYPIFDLNNYYLDIHRYLRDLEEVVIRTLMVYGVHADRDGDYTGVWVGNEKIAAIGVKVSRWITMHGFAFNVNTDLSYFDRIIPCGIFHKGVTSLERIVGRKISLGEIGTIIEQHVASVFGVRCVRCNREEALGGISIHSMENSECLPAANR